MPTAPWKVFSKTITIPATADKSLIYISVNSLPRWAAHVWSRTENVRTMEDGNGLGIVEFGSEFSCENL
jgi:hypothetical protein